MPDIRADEIITRQHKRMFIQYGSARPNNKVSYAGQGTQYIAVNGLTNPESGGISPIWVSDPRRAKGYKLAGRAVTPADLAKAELAIREKHGAIPRQLFRFGCQFSLYELTGVCGDLSDFVSGWSDYILIYSAGLVTDKDFGQRTGFDNDDPIEDRVSITLNDVYPIGPLSFGEGASTYVDLEVIDIVYGSKFTCGNCGPADDGSNRVYAATKASGAGSPGISAEVIYTLDGGANWASSAVTGLGATETLAGIDIAGKYLIVLGSEAYYYTELNSMSGAPGTWTKVTTGFVTGKSPLDLVVISAREIYMCGQGGYIYKVEDVPSGAVVINAGLATTRDLYRIHGAEDVMVAAGSTGAIIKTLNRGITWATTTTSPVALNTIRSVYVMDQLRYWVGADLIGRLYYTLDGGESWIEKGFPGNGSGTVWDVVFPTEEVGFFSHSTTTPTSRLFTTWDGGYTWTNSTPRILNFPNHQKASRIANPMGIDAAVEVNYVALAGLSGGGTDGIILIGAASKL
jgi:hypothetical protein